MESRSIGARAVVFCLSWVTISGEFGHAADTQPAGQRLALSGGSVLIEWNHQALKASGIEASPDADPALTLAVNDESSSFQLRRRDGRNEGLYGTLVGTGGTRWIIRNPKNRENANVGDFHIGFAGRYATVSDSRDLHLQIFDLVPETVSVTYDPATTNLSVSGDIRLAEPFLRSVLSESPGPDRVVGRLTIVGPTREATKASEPEAGAGGPRHSCDVTTGELRGDIDNATSQPRTWGVAGAYAGYSFGTTSCNVGFEPLDWFSTGSATPSEHPVIGQNLFRYSVVNGASRLEQLGQAWLKHGFCALQGSVCLTCTPYCAGCCDQLGVGCSDPYNASRNGGRGGMGPKSQVNGATGDILVWPYPTAPTDDVTTGRVRVLTSDVNPATNPGAVYYAEGQYLSEDEAAAGNDDNNCSYRRVVFGAGPSFTMTWFSTAEGQTVRQTQAIKAWAVHDPSVAFTDIDIDGDGRFTLGYRVTDLSGTGAGPWHYEYALHNMNSDRAGASFTVPLPSGVSASNEGFRDVDYYKDGETIGTPYDGTSWLMTKTPGVSVAWEMAMASPAANSNALRWGTMYNFRFDASTPPEPGGIKLALFKPGTPSSVSVPTLVPSRAPCTCPGDLNASNTVDGEDVAPFVAMYLGQSPVSACADVAAPAAGPLDGADVDSFVALLVNGSGLCN